MDETDRDCLAQALHDSAGKNHNVGEGMARAICQGQGHGPRADAILATLVACRIVAIEAEVAAPPPLDRDLLREALTDIAQNMSHTAHDGGRYNWCGPCRAQAALDAARDTPPPLSSSCLRHDGATYKCTQDDPYCQWPRRNLADEGLAKKPTCGEAVVSKFNRTSERVGAPHRLVTIADLDDDPKEMP